MYQKAERRERATTFEALLKAGVKTLETLCEDYPCRQCGRTFVRSFIVQTICPDCVNEHVRLSAESVRDSLLEERNRRFKRMGLDGLLATMTLDSYVGNEQPEAFTAAVDFAHSWPDAGGLVLLGRTGSGKTHLAVGVLLNLVERGIEGRYVHLPELTAHLRRSTEWAAETHRLIGPLAQTPCLVLDDVGREKSSDAIAEQIDALMNRRWVVGAPTILTANLTEREILGDGESKPGWLSPAAASRIGAVARFIRLKDGDRRIRGVHGRAVPPARNADPTVACPTCQGAGWVCDATVAVGRADRIRECPSCGGRRF